jgi:hypothetical protein
MKYAITSDQRRYFEQQGSVELEELLTSKQLHSLREGIATALQVRLERPTADTQYLNPQQLVRAGHDLWRADERVKKITASHSLAHIAAELTSERILRVGYDQLLLSQRVSTESGPLHSKYTPIQLYTETTTLEASSSINGLIAGLIICLEGSFSPEEALNNSVFPCEPGSGSYISPTTEINFLELNLRKGQRFLLIAYSNRNSQYILNDNDPFTHSLKNLGYVFGDRLNDSDNPIVSR